MNPITTTVCVKCGHNGVREDGYCEEFANASGRCGCKCVFPASTEVAGERCEHGILWSMECLSCGPSDFIAAAAPPVAQPVETVPVVEGELQRSSDDQLSNMQSEQYSVPETLSEVGTGPDAVPQATGDATAQGKAQANVLKECPGCVMAHAGLVMYADKHDEQCKAEHADDPYTSAAAPVAEAARDATEQTWCDHCSADLNAVRHVLCDRCYQDFVRRINTRETLRAAILDWLAHRCDYAPVCGNCIYCRVAVFVRDVEPTEATPAEVEAAAREIRERFAMFPKGKWATVSEAELVEIIHRHCATPAPADAGEVARLRAERLEIQRALASTVLNDPTEDDVPPYTTSEIVNGITSLEQRRRAAVKRAANAIRECVRELRRRADHAESTGNHLPGTDQAMYLHAESRALAKAAEWLLESLAQKEGDDGPTAQ